MSGTPAEGGGTPGGGDDGARLLRRAEALAPELAARSAEVEAARRLPLDLARNLAGEGLFRMLVPRELGGLEAHAGRFVEVVAALARADAAAGWVTMIAATTASASAPLDERWAQAIYGDRPEVITRTGPAAVPRCTAATSATGAARRQHRDPARHGAGRDPAQRGPGVARTARRQPPLPTRRIGRTARAGVVVTAPRRHRRVTPARASSWPSSADRGAARPQLNRRAGAGPPRRSG